MLTQFVILATVRSLVMQLLLAWLIGKLVKERAKAVALAGLIALLCAAALDGATPDGWDFEYLFGHPFYFYLFLNGPIALLVTVCLILLHRKPKEPIDPFA